MKEVEDTEAQCSFCMRGKDSLDVLIHSRLSHSNICEDCATGMFMVFTRRNELHAKAAKLSVGWETQDKSNGEPCKCPGCTFSRLCDSDPIINDIYATMDKYAATEVKGTKH